MPVETDLLNMVKAKVTKVLKQSAFADWLEGEDEFKGGHVGINNSFLFREDLKTRKNSRFLCVPVGAEGKLSADRLRLASNIRFNSKFTYLSVKDKNATYEEMDAALSAAIRTFGRIPLILVGGIVDNVKAESPIDHDLFKSLVLDPTQDSR